MQLHGHNLIAGKTAPDSAKTFHAFSPLDGEKLEPSFHEGTAADGNARGRTCHHVVVSCSVIPLVMTNRSNDG